MGAGALTAAPPPNDNFANRILLQGSPILFSGDTSGATLEAGEPDVLFNPQTVWWTWTAPASGDVVVGGLDAASDMVVGIYTGSTLETLTSINAGYNPTFQAVAGASYQIQAAPAWWNQSQPGPFALHLSLTTVRISSPTQAGSYRAPASFDMTAAPLGPGTIWSSIAFYEDGAHVGTVTSAPFQLPRAAVPIGIHTYVAVATTSGGIISTSAPVTIPVTPSNDDFADRVQLVGETVSIPVTYSPATSEPGEFPHPTNLHKVWFTWTAPFTGVASAWTEENAAAYVYTGSTVLSLTRVGRDSKGLFDVAAGAAYHIAVGAFEYQGNGDPVRSTTLRIQTWHRPPNADFANRLPLAGLSVGVSGSNFTVARFEAGESRLAGYGQGRSVWYTWTAPASGFVEISVTTNAFPPAIGVYFGSSLETLRGVGFDTYRGNFYARGGLNYQIAVDAYADYYGPEFGFFDLALQLTAAPRATNDDFANRTILVGSSLVVTGSNLAATTEPGEPIINSPQGGRSLWWTWTAPTSGWLRLNAMAQTFQPLMATYTGDTLTNLYLNTLYFIPSGVYGLQVEAPVKRGVNYQISFNSLEPNQPPNNLEPIYGDFEFRLAFIPAPPNDDFAARLPITNFPASIEWSNHYATLEPGEPIHASFAGSAHGSVWWTWTAPVSGRAILRDTTFNDRYFGIYTGYNLGSLSYVTNGLHEVGWMAAAGTTYQIAVDGYYGPMRFRLTPPPPVNDLFSARIVLTGESNTVVAHNIGATLDPSEPRATADPGDRKSTRLNSSHGKLSRMPSSA